MRENINKRDGQTIGPVNPGEFPLRGSPLMSKIVGTTIEYPATFTICISVMVV